jgi:hypothetical protein
MVASGPCAKASSRADRVDSSLLSNSSSVATQVLCGVPFKNASLSLLTSGNTLLRLIKSGRDIERGGAMMGK